MVTTKITNKYCGANYGAENDDVEVAPICCDAAMKEYGYKIVDYKES